jgi:hypothetical protein
VAAEAERVYAQLTRDTLNEAAPARLDQMRITIMKFGYLQEAGNKRVLNTRNREGWGSGVGDSTKFRAYR